MIPMCPQSQGDLFQISRIFVIRRLSSLMQITKEAKTPASLLGRIDHRQACLIFLPNRYILLTPLCMAVSNNVFVLDD